MSQRVTLMMHATQIVDRIDEHTHVLGISELRDAVAQIEYMARAISIGGEDSLRLSAYALRRSEEDSGIEIAL